MSVLGAERAAIADVVTQAYAEYGDGVYGDGTPGENPVTVHQYVPDRLVPPAAIITPADPYLERRADDPFGTLTAAWEIWLVRATGSNQNATEGLDAEIEYQADALTKAGFTVERVSEPFMYAVQGANYLTTIIHVATGVTLTK